MEIHFFLHTEFVKSVINLIVVAARIQITFVKICRAVDLANYAGTSPSCCFYLAKMYFSIQILIDFRRLHLSMAEPAMDQYQIPPIFVIFFFHKNNK